MKCIYFCVRSIVLFLVSVPVLSQPKKNPTDAKSAETCKEACGRNTNCVVEENIAYCSCKPGFKGDPWTECVPRGTPEGHGNNLPTDSDNRPEGQKTTPPTDSGSPVFPININDNRPEVQKTTPPTDSDNRPEGQKATIPTDSDTAQGAGTTLQPSRSITVSKDKTYTLYIKKKSWFKAQDYCVSRGMTLAEIRSEAELDYFLKLHVPSVQEGKKDYLHLDDRKCWIGGNDLGDNLTKWKIFFRWMSNLDLVEFNKFDFEDNYSVTAHCLIVNDFKGDENDVYKWVALGCQNEHVFVCQSRK